MNRYKNNAIWFAASMKMLLDYADDQHKGVLTAEDMQICDHLCNAARERVEVFLEEHGVTDNKTLMEAIEQATSETSNSN